jgi:hypothetical protein
MDSYLLAGEFNLTRLSFEMMAGNKFEDEEAEAGAGGEGGVEEPEGGGRHRLAEAAVSEICLGSVIFWAGPANN